MLQWVYERAKASAVLKRVIVASGDKEILEIVEAFGGETFFTRGEFLNGTERVAEVAKTFPSEIIVNIQGDEPLLTSEMLTRVVNLLREDKDCPMATLKEKISSLEDYHNPNIVKVVTDRQGWALFFSRAPIPYRAKDGKGYKHIGIYAYRRDFLLEFIKLPSSDLELAENLEQLRALEFGYRVKVAEVKGGSINVDTLSDFQKVEKILSENVQKNNQNRQT
jgi:3-deoxy-manno-octulosonate cytidylyltransferase (CMP-KDO synthetase)